MAQLRTFKETLQKSHSCIEEPFRFTKLENIHVGENVLVRKNAWFSLLRNCHLYIGNGTRIGRNLIVSGVGGEIRIGDNVLISERVFITESIHGYEDIEKPIMQQPSLSRGNVTIKDDCWLGVHVCVMPNVTIGKHCVIGANAVVTKSIPDFSVAAGVPAHVIKEYNFELNKWVKQK